MQTYKLEQQQIRCRNMFVELRQALHLSVRGASVDDLSALIQPDDFVQYFSFVYALNKVLNRMTAVARRVAEEKGSSRSAWLQL